MVTPLRQTPLLPGTLENLFYQPEHYTYFARATEVPFASSGAAAKVAWAADASMLAYARYGRRLMTNEELDANFGRAGLQYTKIGGTPENWNAHGTQAVFATCPQFALLVFRGTEKDDPEDALTDSDLTLSHEPDYRPVAADPGPALGHLAIVTQLFSEPCFVHRGFQKALNEVWDEVHQRVTTYRATHPGAEICVTGHSLGAALAVLAFSRFADPDISLYTFGCPRVGNGAFRNRVVSNPSKGIYRYVNFNDAVSHVPLDSLLYKQTPESCYRIAADGSINSDDGTFKGDIDALRTTVLSLPASLRLGGLDQIPAPDSLVDHSSARYCFRLWDCV